MICKNCGFSNDEFSKQCTQCGADLSSQDTYVSSYNSTYQNTNQGQYSGTNPGAYQYPYQEMNQNSYQGINQNPYQSSYQNANQGYPYPNQVPDPGKGFAIASMVCGIVSFFCFAYITGILGIVFGAVAKSKGSKSNMATAGIVCGIIGIILYVLILIAIYII